MITGKPLLAVLVLALAGATAAHAADPDPAELKVALLPDENASTIIKNNKPLERYLEEKLGKGIELVVTTDYSSMIEAMRFKRIDLAYFGPLSYTLAKAKGDIEPFAALKTGGSTTYHSVLIVNKAAGIATFDDIKGKDVAFGDTASTSSHLIPKSILVNAGLEAGRDYRAHFAGSHDAVAVAVQNGHAQAGGLSKPIFESLVARGIVSLDTVAVLETSKPFPQYPWAMRSDLDRALKDRIRAAFLQLDDPSVLKPFEAEGFGAVTDGDYDVVRDLARSLNLSPGS